jgi:hypothetical protein
VSVVPTSGESLVTVWVLVLETFVCTVVEVDIDTAADVLLSAGVSYIIA